MSSLEEEYNVVDDNEDISPIDSVLPNEVMVIIFEYLSCKDLLEVRLVNERWNRGGRYPMLYTKLMRLECTRL